MPVSPSRAPKLIIGRYALFDEIAAGGMATVHLGLLLGTGGFSRTVAIKRLHPALAKDPDFATMFLDEARLAARVRHPNVVQTLDIEAVDGELFVVMEYVQGESLMSLFRTLRRSGRRLPPPIAVHILCDVLHGLHAAHEACDERGEPLGIIHRDVSPQNVIVGADGIARVLDFGIAKAMGRLHTTREGQLKGKLGYMAPEQVRGDGISRRVDVYAASIVLWEMLVGQRLFAADSEAELIYRVLEGRVTPPRRMVPELPAELEAAVMTGLEREPHRRFANALEMATAIEKTVPAVTRRDVGAWVDDIAHPSLTLRAEKVAIVELASTDPGRLSLPDVALGDRSSRLELTSHADPTLAASAANISEVHVGRRRGSWVFVAAIGIAAGAFAAWRIAATGSHERAAGMTPAGASEVTPAASVVERPIEVVPVASSAPTDALRPTPSATSVRPTTTGRPRRGPGARDARPAPIDDLLGRD